jgi:hypothetical protein
MAMLHAEEVQMRFAPRLALLALPLLMLLNLPARANEIQVGTGPVCDTQQQAERFAALYDGDAQTAVSTINAEEHNETACGIVTMAYMPGPPLATARQWNMTFQIVEVLVVGVVTPEGIHAVEPVRLYSVLTIEEIDV